MPGTGTSQKGEFLNSPIPFGFLLAFTVADFFEFDQCFEGAGNLCDEEVWGLQDIPLLFKGSTRGRARNFLKRVLRERRSSVQVLADPNIRIYPL